MAVYVSQATYNAGTDAQRAGWTVDPGITPRPGTPQATVPASQAAAAAYSPPSAAASILSESQKQQILFQQGLAYASPNSPEYQQLFSKAAPTTGALNQVQAQSYIPSPMKPPEFNPTGLTYRGEASQPVQQPIVAQGGSVFGGYSNVGGYEVNYVAPAPLMSVEPSKSPYGYQSYQPPTSGKAEAQLFTPGAQYMLYTGEKSTVYEIDKINEANAKILSDNAAKEREAYQASRSKVGEEAINMAAAFEDLSIAYAPPRNGQQFSVKPIAFLKSSAESIQLQNKPGDWFGNYARDYTAGLIRMPEMIGKTGIAVAGIWKAELTGDTNAFATGVPATRTAVSKSLVDPGFYASAIITAGTVAIVAGGKGGYKADLLEKTDFKLNSEVSYSGASVLGQPVIGKTSVFVDRLAGHVGSDSAIGGGIISVLPAGKGIGISGAGASRVGIGPWIDVNAYPVSSTWVLGTPRFGGARPGIESSAQNVADVNTLAGFDIKQQAYLDYAKASGNLGIGERFSLVKSGASSTYYTDIPFSKTIETMANTPALKGLSTETMGELINYFKSNKGQIDQIYGSFGSEMRGASARGFNDIDLHVKNIKFSEDVAGIISRGGGNVKLSPEGMLTVNNVKAFDFKFDTHDIGGVTKLEGGGSGNFVGKPSSIPSTVMEGVAGKPSRFGTSASGTGVGTDVVNIQEFSLLTGNEPVISGGIGLGFTAKKPVMSTEGFPFMATGEQTVRVGSSMQFLRQDSQGNVFLGGATQKAQRMADLISLVEKSSEVSGNTKYANFGEQIKPYLNPSEKAYFKSNPDVAGKLNLYSAPSPAAPSAASVVGFNAAGFKVSPNVYTGASPSAYTQSPSVYTSSVSSSISGLRSGSLPSPSIRVSQSPSIQSISPSMSPSQRSPSPSQSISPSPVSQGTAYYRYAGSISPKVFPPSMPSLSPSPSRPSLSPSPSISSLVGSPSPSPSPPSYPPSSPPSNYGWGGGGFGMLAGISGIVGYNNAKYKKAKGVYQPSYIARTLGFSTSRSQGLRAEKTGFDIRGIIGKRRK